MSNWKRVYDKNRQRPIQFTFKCTQDEFNYLELEKLVRGFKNRRDFIMNLAVHGEVVTIENDELYNVANEINRHGVIINQVAKRVNENKSVCKADIDVLKTEMEKVKQIINKNFK